MKRKKKGNDMETYTLEDIKDKVYGETGTPRRDKIETELSNLRVGLQIRNAREAKKMTQSELAGKIGKERSFISKVEREGSNLTLSTLYDIVTKGLGGKLNIEVQF
jgi:ribosome-binding protein aMBF1 (putative translation factor)